MIKHPRVAKPPERQHIDKVDEELEEQRPRRCIQRIDHLAWLAGGRQHEKMQNQLLRSLRRALALVGVAQRYAELDAEAEQDARQIERVEPHDAMDHEFACAHASGEFWFVSKCDHEAAEQEEQVHDHRAAGRREGSPRHSGVSDHHQDRAEPAKAVEQNEVLLLNGLSA